MVAHEVTRSLGLAGCMELARHVEPGWLMCSLNENNMQVCGFEAAMLKPGADSREKKSHAAGLCSGPRVEEAYGSGRARKP